MNILKGNILKGFAAVAMLCMIGAVFATPVALGDVGYELYKNGYISSEDWNDVKDKTTGIGMLGAGIAIIQPEIGAGMIIGASAEYL
jgi:hypothetical protein